VCGVIDFDFANTIPRSTSCFSTPRSSNPTLSPACPSSRSLRNISTPVTTVFLSVPNPTISTSSPTFPFPRSIRPLAPLPPPAHPRAVLGARQQPGQRAPSPAAPTGLAGRRAPPHPPLPTQRGPPRPVRPPL